MLSTNSVSSIQKRRQLHRRQQSLEVPILATPLPTNNRRHSTARAGNHRRGLSLDQSMSSPAQHAHPAGFRPLRPQDSHGRPTGTISARNTTDTNPATQLEQQHQLKQETQEHSLSQPGFHHPQLHHPQPQQQISTGFQSHLHQQLNGLYPNGSAAPNAEQAVAMQNLQSHLSWYNDTFGHHNPQARGMPGPGMPPSLRNGGAVQVPMYVTHPGSVGMHGPNGMPLHHPRTVPNTPQNRPQGWPSPPPTRIKHGRSHSHQLDVNSMPSAPHGSFGAAPGYHNGSFEYGEDPNYAASAYSSSIADPTSPQSFQHGTAMPTVYEDDHVGMMVPPAEALLMAAAGVQDFNDPNFIIGGFCQEQATLDQMGIDATYIETGTKESDLDAWLESPHGDVKFYVCKWEGCAHPQINRKENARSHVQNHLDDRKWKCNPCGKRFTRLHDLKRHALTHTNERPAICPCGKSFARQDALTRHRQRDMCRGVLPGFEKSEEDKPKRGRPKKDRSGELNEKSRKPNRPDMESRTQKAAMARRLDKAMVSESSDHSMPHTPPQEPEHMDAVNFFDIDSAVSGITVASQAWIDTPPSSPPTVADILSSGKDASSQFDAPGSISPSKLSEYTSPLANGTFTAASFYDGSSPTDASTVIVDSSFYSASSPVPPKDNTKLRHASPVTAVSKMDMADHHSSHDSVLGQSSPIAACAAEEGITLNADSTNFASFLSSVALTGPTDFGASISCDSSAGLFGSTANLLESYPAVGEDPFSPPGESHSSSSTYNSSDVDINNEHIFRKCMGPAHQQVSSSIFNDRVDDAFGNPFDDPGLPGPTTEEQIEAFLAGL